MDEKNYELAIEAFELALKSDKEFVLALDDLAVCYKVMENFDKAIKYYLKSLSIFPECDFALMNLAAIYNLKSDFKTANNYYKKLIAYQPQNPEGYYGLGKNLIIDEDYTEAFQNVIKAHKIYIEENSDYQKDTEVLLELIFQQMKDAGKEKEFRKMASDANSKVIFSE